MFEFDVTSIIPTPPKENNTLTTSDTITTSSTIYDYTWPNYFTNTYSYTSVVYKYQLICPKCKTTNWGEIDQVVNCTGGTGNRKCKATLKAIKQPVDFEVPVG